MGEKHKHKKSPESSPVLEQEVYDYKGLLTANVNLIDIIDSGQTVNFDCPPINFNQIDYSSIPKDQLHYFKSVKCDHQGKIVLNEFEQKMINIIQERRKKNNQLYEKEKEDKI